jgi:hypothetical protein
LPPGAVPSSKNLVDGTVPSSKIFVDGTSKKGIDSEGRGIRGREGRWNFPLLLFSQLSPAEEWNISDKYNCPVAIDEALDKILVPWRPHQPKVEITFLNLATFFSAQSSCWTVLYWPLTPTYFLRLCVLYRTLYQIVDTCSYFFPYFLLIFKISVSKSSQA